MVVLTLPEEDVQYLIDVLKDQDNRIRAHKIQGTLEESVCDRLVRRNSGIQSIFEARMIPYICIITDDTGDVHRLTFKEFEKYFGSIPEGYNESQVMSYIADWCGEHGYSIDFQRENKIKSVG